MKATGTLRVFGSLRWTVRRDSIEFTGPEQQPGWSNHDWCQITIDQPGCSRSEFTGPVEAARD
jgi:hypothetical protein